MSLPANPAETLLSPLTSIIHSLTLGELIAACRESVRMPLGIDAPCESLFWVAWPEVDPLSGRLLSESALAAGRVAEPAMPGLELRMLLAGMQGGARIFDNAPAELLQRVKAPDGPASMAQMTLAIRPEPFDESAPAILWLLGWTAEAEEALGENGSALISSLESIASMAAMRLPGLLEMELAKRENESLARLSDLTLELLVEPDPSVMLSDLLGIVTRELGMRRVCILLVQPETQMLRADLHTGFDPGFNFPTLSLDKPAHPFIDALHQGRVLTFERSVIGEAGPAWLLSEGDALPARAMLLPLSLPQKRVGIIYADQAQHDGLPLFTNVLIHYARLAAVAIYHQQQQGRAEQRAETDPLTGLRNRYSLDKMLEIEVPRVKRYNTPISLLMIDLVDFKQINDHYGHQFGDFILRETANLLQAGVRRGDVVIRYGGDEFIVLMANTNYEGASLVRDRIEQMFIERNRLQTQEKMVILISLGLRSAGADDIDGLLHEADMAMYEHKSRQTRRHLLAALVAGDVERIESIDRMVGSLCNILYKKEPYYREHARRVAHLALRLATRLDIRGEEIETLALAALLHDVGKVSMPTEVLMKREPLSGVEREAMRHHPGLGEELFQGIQHLEAIRPLIRHHHERFDGVMDGDYPAYPDGLAGERLPLAARILCLAESVDGMLNDRPYRPQLSPEAMERVLKEESGKAYDPKLVRLFLQEKEELRDWGRPDAIMKLVGEGSM